jgi:hypothetical protein
VCTIISMTDVKAAGRQDMNMIARDTARKPTDTCLRGVQTLRRTRRRQVAVGSAPGEYRAAAAGRFAAADTYIPQCTRRVAGLGDVSPQQ